MTIPCLRTERLILRAPAPDDFPVYRDFYSDAEASAFYGGPLTDAQAWRKLAFDLGHWQLRGFGMWSVVDQATGAQIGGCGIVWPEGWPRHELTWWIVPQARRRGYAEEASRAVIDWARDRLGWSCVETHMNDANEAARRLVEKLGGTAIAREFFPDGIERNVYALAPGAGASAART
jgi:[ribosomal protein S5]-alanine N-acetyltransferase